MTAAILVIAMETPYTRFLIVSNARTGSNLVQQALNSHPSVVCFRELFNLDPAYIDYDVEGWDPRSDADLALRKSDVAAFLREQVFGDHAAAVKAVGFKFHYDHFWFAEKLVPSLVEDAGLRVIHLRRLNRLRTFVSWKIADQTGEWLRHDELRQRRSVVRRKLSLATAVSAVLHPIDSARRVRNFLRPVNKPPAAAREPLTLTTAECDAFFYKVGHEEEHFAALFAAHPSIEITYEHLVADRDAVFREMESFLGIGQADFTTTLRRQNPEPLRELIANYNELREYYTGKPQEHYFDE